MWIGFPKESKRDEKISENRIQACLGERSEERNGNLRLPKSENKENSSGRMK